MLLSPGDDPSRDMHPLVTAIFGATAGAASVFGNTPLDVVKTRMQVDLSIAFVFSVNWFLLCHHLRFFFFKIYRRVWKLIVTRTL